LGFTWVAGFSPWPIEGWRKTRVKIENSANAITFLPIISVPPLIDVPLFLFIAADLDMSNQ
jgi:hypothetical protein